MPPSTNPFLFVAGNSYGRLAQLVEHTPDKGEVAGSSPASPTILNVVATVLAVRRLISSCRIGANEDIIRNSATNTALCHAVACFLIGK